MGRQRNDILQGTLALVVLRTLSVHGRLHGYAITRHIQTASQDLLRVEEGSLYPALHRMEQDGWVKAEWGTTEKNRPARLYSLTAVRPPPAGAGAGELGPPHPRRRPSAALRLSRRHPFEEHPHGLVPPAPEPDARRRALA